MAPIIIIVDDSAAERARYDALLSAAGFTVESFDGAAHALARIRDALEPLIIITDWVMPNISGLQFVAMLRALDFDISPYIMMLTGRSEKVSIVSALNRGADDYLPKTVSDAEVVARPRVAERAIRRHEAQAQKIDRLQEIIRRFDIRYRIVDERDGDCGSLRGLEAGSVAAVLRSATSVLKAVHAEPPAQLPDSPASNDIAEPSDLAFWSWTGVGIPEDNSWLDIRLSVSREVALALHSAMVQTDPTSQMDLCDLLAETTNLIQGALKSELQRAGVRLISPHLPSCFEFESSRPPPIPSDTVHHRYEVSSDVGSLFLDIFETRADVQDLLFAELRSGQVLPETLYSADGQVVLLRAGTVLDARFIARLKEQVGGADCQVSVFAMSPMSVDMVATEHGTGALETAIQRATL